MSPACLYQSPTAATRPRRQHPPGLRERQGGRAVRGGRPATPRGRRQSYFQGSGEYKRADPKVGSNCNGVELYFSASGSLTASFSTALTAFKMVEFSVVKSTEEAAVARLSGARFSGSQVEVKAGYGSSSSFYIMSNGTQYNGEEYDIRLIQCVGYD